MPSTRIGIVMPIAEQRGGAEQALRDFLAGTPANQRDRYRILFLADGPLVSEVSERGYRVEVVRAGRLRNVVRFVLTIGRINRWIRDNDLGIVFSWMSKAHLYCSIPARLRGIKSAWFQHDVYAGSLLDRVNATLPTDLVVCCSLAGATAQRQAFPSLRVVPVHLSVNHDRFDPAKHPSPVESRRRLGINSDRRTVVLVARLERWKGVHVFVAAAIKLLQEWSQLQFFVVGSEHPLDPGYADEVKKMASKSGFGDRIVFAGHQPNVPEWMAAADVVVHTSIKPEPFGIVVLEAMALGRPLIASASGGPLEVITSGEDGLLVEPGSADVLADAISELLADDARRTSMGSAARRTASAFTPERLAANIGQALDSLDHAYSGPKY